jgi:hypothetical protein
MEPFKLRVKIGPHEFEAVGDQESVERQFERWRELVAALPAIPSELPSPPPGEGGSELPPGEFDKVFRRDGEVISLSVLPTGDRAEADAALLLLLGQRQYVSTDLVTGGRLLQGLERSGLTVGRADRVFGDYIPRFVIRSGQHRAVRYRLTNLGLTRAQELMEELLRMVP